jgi:hypothetical protein
VPVDGGDARSVDVHPGVVDNRVQRSECVHLRSDVEDLGATREIADDEVGAALHQTIEFGGAPTVPGVDEDAVSVVDEGGGCRPAETGR